MAFVNSGNAKERLQRISSLLNDRELIKDDIEEYGQLEDLMEALNNIDKELEDLGYDMMNAVLNMADVLDYMADIWSRKLKADRAKNTRESNRLTYEYFTLEDMVVYCMGKDNDESRMQIARHVQCRISEKIFDE